MKHHSFPFPFPLPTLSTLAMLFALLLCGCSGSSGDSSKADGDLPPGTPPPVGDDDVPPGEDPPVEDPDVTIRFSIPTLAPMTWSLTPIRTTVHVPDGTSVKSYRWHLIAGDTTAYYQTCGACSSPSVRFDDPGEYGVRLVFTWIDQEEAEHEEEYYFHFTVSEQSGNVVFDDILLIDG